MGFGDDIMATGMARGAADRGKRIAFGDKKRIIWGPWSKEIFRNNRNVAPPGSEHAPDIEWIPYYKGNRIYNVAGNNRWIWNLGFRAKPGEIFFDEDDGLDWGEGQPPILIEPNVPPAKSVAGNKDWGFENYQLVADALRDAGHYVVQPNYGRPILRNISYVQTRSFRQALYLLSKCRLAILPEGGLHHGAAALGVPAVVIFGGFIPPTVTGYDGHVNLTGTDTFCGSWLPCGHCKEAMFNISISRVLQAAHRFLK